MKPAPRRRPKCELGSPICSGELMQRLDFQGTKAYCCGACLVYFKLRTRDGKVLLRGRK